MALPSASEVPTTSPSHESTSGGHMESYGAYQRKRNVLAHPRLHLPGCCPCRSPVRTVQSCEHLRHTVGFLDARAARPYNGPYFLSDLKRFELGILNASHSETEIRVRHASATTVMCKD